MPISIRIVPEAQLLKTGQTTQYDEELDDGYYGKGVAKAYSVLTTGQYNSTANIDLIHRTRTDISFTAETKTVTCTGQMGVFKAAGGQTIVISGAAQAGNNGVKTTVSATANTIVVNEALTDEAAGATVSIAKREALSNNCVQDLMTGLMWARYTSVQNAVMGAASNGLMPWTGQLYDIFQWCAAANAAKLGGYSDWRIPNDFELSSLRNTSQSSGLPDSTAFPGWPAGGVWGSTVCSGWPTYALYVHFPSGSGGYFLKTVALYAALVRGGT